MTRSKLKNNLKLAWLLIPGFFCLTLSACHLPTAKLEPDSQTVATPIAGTPTQSASVIPASITPPQTETPIPPTATLSPTLTQTPTPTPTPTQTPTSTETATPTITPTYAVLRGKVIPERANCRYGPGAPYLYKYGLVGGSNLEIIGRTDTGTWILIRAIGGSNPCWVKADLMEVKGDVKTVEPVSPSIIQAWSPYYAPLTGVTATRNGDTVIVSWHPLILRAGDEADPVRYVLEAWVCQNGEFIFVPVGSSITFTEVVDEAGCKQESWGQVLGAEKHGYTWPVKVPWP